MIDNVGAFTPHIQYKAINVVKFMRARANNLYCAKH